MGPVAGEVSSHRWQTGWEIELENREKKRYSQTPQAHRPDTSPKAVGYSLSRVSRCVLHHVVNPIPSGVFGGGQETRE